MLEWAEFWAGTLHRSFWADGVVLLKDGEPIGLVTEDPHAHEGIPVVTTAQMLTWAGIPQHPDIRWTKAEYEKLVKALGEDRAL